MKMARRGWVKLVGRWRELKALLNPRDFIKRLERNVGKATALNARLVAREMRQTIKRGVSPRNAPLTVALKGSSKTLVDRGELFKAITGRKVSWDRGFAGVMRQIAGGDVETYNLATLLHEGATIAVSDRMRTMFAMLSFAAVGGMDPSKLRGRAAELWKRRPGFPWQALKPETTSIRIPGRKWAEKAIADRALADNLLKNWREAVDRTFRGE